MRKVGYKPTRPSIRILRDGRGMYTYVLHLIQIVKLASIALGTSRSSIASFLSESHSSLPGVVWRVHYYAVLFPQSETFVNCRKSSGFGTRIARHGTFRSFAQANKPSKTLLGSHVLPFPVIFSFDGPECWIQIAMHTLFSSLGIMAYREKHEAVFSLFFNASPTST